MAMISTAETVRAHKLHRNRGFWNDETRRENNAQARRTAPPMTLTGKWTRHKITGAGESRRVILKGATREIYLCLGGKAMGADAFAAFCRSPEYLALLLGRTKTLRLTAQVKPVPRRGGPATLFVAREATVVAEAASHA